MSRIGASRRQLLKRGSAWPSPAWRSGAASVRLRRSLPGAQAERRDHPRRHLRRRRREVLGALPRAVQGADRHHGQAPADPVRRATTTRWSRQTSAKQLQDVIWTFERRSPRAAPGWSQGPRPPRPSRGPGLRPGLRRRSLERRPVERQALGHPLDQRDGRPVHEHEDVPGGQARRRPGQADPAEELGRDARLHQEAQQAVRPDLRLRAGAPVEQPGRLALVALALPEQGLVHQGRPQRRLHQPGRARGLRLRDRHLPQAPGHSTRSISASPTTRPSSPRTRSR